MPVQAEVDKIEEYLGQVFARIDYTPPIMRERLRSGFGADPSHYDAGIPDPDAGCGRFPAEARAYRSTAEMMRREMGDKLRFSVVQLEEIGYSHDEAVQRTLSKLKDPAKLRRQVIRRIDEYCFKRDAAKGQPQIPWWRQLLESSEQTLPCFVYFVLYNAFPRHGLNVSLILDALGIVPMALAMGFSVFGTTRDIRVKRSPMLAAELPVLAALAAGSSFLPVESILRIIVCGLSCAQIGSLLGSSIYRSLRPGRLGGA